MSEEFSFDLAMATMAMVAVVCSGGLCFVAYCFVRAAFQHWWRKRRPKGQTPPS